MQQHSLIAADHRSLFLSDLHLGSISARPDLVLQFLEHNEARHYVLVGDILDLWQPMPVHWPPAAQAVVDHLRARHLDGARLTYITGNHDPAPDAAPDPRRLPIAAQADLDHVAADGRRYLVVHGDCQDHRLLRAHMLTRLGTWADQGLRRLDRALSRLAGTAGPERRSVIEWLLSCVNAALYPVRSHERRLADLARTGGFDGVICGHFHLAGFHQDHGVIYANCGDWVDSFTALAEGHDGRLRLLGGREAMAGYPGVVPGRGLAAKAVEV
jgi:UDP-2,3-diacylglucosamine pyrophosphatase LpxH